MKDLTRTHAFFVVLSMSTGERPAWLNGWNAAAVIYVNRAAIVRLARLAFRRVQGKLFRDVKTGEVTQQYEGAAPRRR